jgi:hypothetical protein
MRTSTSANHRDYNWSVKTLTGSQVSSILGRSNRWWRQQAGIHDTQPCARTGVHRFHACVTSPSRWPMFISPQDIPSRCWGVSPFSFETSRTGLEIAAKNGISSIDDETPPPSAPSDVWWGVHTRLGLPGMCRSVDVSQGSVSIEGYVL